MTAGKYIRTKKIKANMSKAHIGKNIGKDNPAYKPECHDYETRICDPECGCGGTFICLKRSKQKYINYHYSKTKKFRKILIEINSGENSPRFGKKHTEKTKALQAKIRTGTHRSKESKIKQSKARTGKYTGENAPMFGRTGEKAPMFGKPAPKGSGYSSKQGYRNDLKDIWFRSTWDANMTRIFNWEGIPSEYECKRFPLIRKDGSKITYCPDHHITGTTIWYEQKGYMNPKSAEKIQLFKEQYPDQTLIVIGPKEYKKMTETYKDLIPNWEK